MKRAFSLLNTGLTILVVLLIVSACVLLIAVSLPVHAHEAGTDPDADWYRSLKRPNGMGSCCDMKDCKRTSEWKIEGEHYRVMGERGEWLGVDDEVVLRNVNNPTGMAVACIHENKSWGYQSTEPQITESVLCFVPPVGV
jgi:hypothetical protein